MPKTSPGAPQRPSFTLEDAIVKYRNFAGTVNEFNKEGKKSFAIELEESFAQRLMADGWHVNYTDPKEEGDVSVPFINIKVNFKNRPPRVVMVTPDSMVPLTDHSIGMLDDADIINVDLTCIGNPWERGISCYLQKAFFKINVDILDQKYGFGYLSQEESDD
jgi:hypothetical protein